MDVVRALEGSARGAGGRPLPVAWRAEERFAGLETIDQLISAIRDVDARSDRVLAALVDRGPDDATASVVVLAALLRLGLGRCHGDGDRMDSLAAELAVVLGEAWRDELPPWSHRRLAGVMIDRAWGRVRAAERKGQWMQPVSLDAAIDRLPGATRSPEDVAVSRVAVEQFRRALARSNRPGCAPVVRAWDTTAALIEQPEISRRQRLQLRYARSVLRERVTPDLELGADLM